MDASAVSEQWKAASIARCRKSFRDARTVADRLASLRSLVRLQDGRTVLVNEGIVLTEAESSQLSRFGLAVSGDALRMNDAGHIPAFGSRHPFTLDSQSRRPWIEASPDAILLRLTGHAAYRTTTQKSAVRAILTMPVGASLMVGMPTGSGKSLLFQLEVLEARSRQAGACAVVITPTVALALDHARTVSRIPGLEGSRALSGDLSTEQREDVVSAFRRGEVPLLFMSPESALGVGREPILEAATPISDKLHGLNAHLSSVYIDEAHIVESWGRTFRPDFQRLSGLVKDLRNLQPTLKVVLLSATLTPPARQVLRQAYAIDAQWLEIEAGLPRYEYDIFIRAFADRSERDQELDTLVDHAPRPLIIYTTRVADAKSLCNRLKSRGYERIALFTGEVSGTSERLRIVNDWSDDRLDIVVSTSAFGMGVDKSDVRCVIHACIPESPARWYQEIGRAARDGHQGFAICLFTTTAGDGAQNDVSDALHYATTSWLSRDTAQARWKALLDRPVHSELNEHHLLTLDLDATHHGLTQHSGDYNRMWNMSLLNLMQRAGVIDVLSADNHDTAETWTVQIRDPGVLDGDHAAVWDAIFALRDRELDAGRRDLRQFVSVMSQPEESCVIQELFQLVAGVNSSSVPECGRCPACRKHGRTPPESLHSGGLEQFWTALTLPSPTGLPPGVTLIDPEDPTFGVGLNRLLGRLAAVGVEQFVVPDELSARVAQSLVGAPVCMGLVLSYSELRSPLPATLAAVPTAVLLGHDETLASELIALCRKTTQSDPRFTLAVVARPDRVDNQRRRLDQSISSRAAYGESLLDQLAPVKGIAS